MFTHSGLLQNQKKSDKNGGFRKKKSGNLM